MMHLFPFRLWTLLLLGGLLLGASSWTRADGEDVAALQPLITRQWLLVKDDKLRNIQVYSKREDDRRIRSMKAEAELQAGVTDLVNALMDFKRYPEWFWRVKETRLLNRVSPLEAYVHVVFSPPFGFPDRDVVLHFTAYYERGGQRASVHASAVPDYLPSLPGCVRMPYAELDAKIGAREHGRSYFRGEVVMDPGGQLPVWTSNLVQRQGPYYTMLGLLKLLDRKTADTGGRTHPLRTASE